MSWLTASVLPFVRPHKSCRQHNFEKYWSDAQPLMHVGTWILTSSRTHQFLAGLPWPLTYFTRPFIIKILFFRLVGRTSQEVLVLFPFMPSDHVYRWILTASRTHQYLVGVHNVPWPLIYFSMSFIVKYCFSVLKLDISNIVQCSYPHACIGGYWQPLERISFWLVYLDLWSTFHVRFFGRDNLIRFGWHKLPPPL